MTLFPKPSRLALQILTYMVCEDAERMHLLEDLAAAAAVSKPTAAKVLTALEKGGILSSRKGPGGGFCLARPPEEVTLAGILSAVKGEDHLSECVGLYGCCSDENPCSLHEKWAAVRGELVQYLESTNLKSIALRTFMPGQI